MKARNFWKQAAPVAVLTIVVAVAVSILAYVDSITRDKIAAQEQQKLEQRLQETFPAMSRYEFEDDIYTIYADGDRTGYAFVAIGKGYGGDINILVGLEDETTIKGITIVSHVETPGLGTRIAESPWIDQFVGINIDDVALSGDGGKVDAITGSTISAAAVVDAVRATAMEKVKLLKAREGGG